MAYQPQDNTGLYQSGGGYGDSLGDSLDVNVRHGFIRKVFSIVFAQLLFTSLIGTPFVMYQREIIQALSPGGFQAILIGVMVLTIGTICYMSCFPEVGRKYPTNYILLGIITSCMGVMTGIISAQYTVVSLLAVMAMTSAITFCLMLFATQTKYDFTGMGPYLFVALIVLSIFGFVLIFWHSHIAMMIRAGLGALLFSFYIVYDTQLIVGGKHKKHEFSIDDYVFAALALYMDIINLFLFLLELFGERR